MKKEELLNKLRSNTKFAFDMPDMHIDAITYDDPIHQFIKMSQSVGGDVEEVKDDNYNINDIIRKHYPDARHIASNMEEVTIANLNPDTIAEAQDLNGTDVAVVKGEWGVAENGCIWVPQTMKEKAELFITEVLVIVLSRQRILNNMHEAYARIEMTSYGYGCFISGPSKTADIEQALVLGAQAARSVLVIVTP